MQHHREAKDGSNLLSAKGTRVTRLLAGSTDVITPAAEASGRSERKPPTAVVVAAPMRCGKYVGAEATFKGKMVRALIRLRRALAAVPKEQRLEALQQLSSRVRAHLLAHMESHCAHRPPGGCATARGKAGPNSSPSVSCKAKAPPASAATAMMQEEQRLRLGVSRVGKGKWRAQAFFLNMRSITSCVSSLDRALVFQALLTQMKRTIIAQAARLSSAAMNPEAVFAIVQGALTAACESNGVGIDELGLAYRAEVSAGRILNRDVWGRYSLELRKALDERQVLLAGKAAGWPGLRAAWMTVLREPVLVRGAAPNWARQPPLSANAAASIVDAAWEANAPSRERAKSRRQARERRKLRKEAARMEREALEKARALRIPNPCARRERQARRIMSAGNAVERAAAMMVTSGRRVRQRSVDPRFGRQHIVAKRMHSNHEHSHKDKRLCLSTGRDFAFRSGEGSRV